MKPRKDRSSSLKPIVASAAVLAGLALPAQAVVVSVSGTNATNDAAITAFINASFTNVTSVTYGDYSNPANIPVGTEVLIIGRSLSSTSYANSTNSATFNALTIPIVSFTSYVTRPDGGRWGWESGGVVGEFNEVGSETTVTASGASILGINAGAQDLWTASGSEFALGSGTVGTGTILASIATNSSGTGILAAGWTAGQTTAGGATLGGNRLLFNAFQSGSATILPDTADGQTALANAIAHYTPLNVPEPSVALLGGLGLLGVLRRQRA